MIHTRFNIFISVFKNQFIKSPKQWLVYGLLVLFFAFAIFFYSYIKEFREQYIDKLRGLYPIAYLQTHGTKLEPIDNQFFHEQELFDISSSFSFKYHMDKQTKMIIDVGIRSTRHFPKIIPNRDADSQNNCIWMNQYLWNEMNAQNDFDGNGIYWIDNSGKPIYVKIKTFELPGSKKWILIPDLMADKLQLDYNISTIYCTNPEKEINESFIKNQYSKSGFNVISWTDRLPFLSYVSYMIALRIYAIFIISFFILVVLLILGVLQDTFDELTRLIKFSALYGISELFLHVFFSGFIVVYYLGTILFSDIIMVIVNKLIHDLLPIHLVMQKPPLIIYCLIMLIPIIGSTVFIQLKYHKPFEG